MKWNFKKTYLFWNSVSNVIELQRAAAHIRARIVLSVSVWSARCSREKQQQSGKRRETKIHVVWW